MATTLPMTPRKCRIMDIVQHITENQPPLKGLCLHFLLPQKSSQQIKGPYFSRHSLFNPLPLCRRYKGLKSPRVAAGFRATEGIGSVKELWKHHVAVMAYREEYLNAWKHQNIEVLLCPSLGPALNIGYAGKLSAASSYMVIFNLLNFPAGVLPVTKVTEEDEKELMNYTGYRNDIWDRTFKKAMAGGVDLPLAVQCVALPWQDELCLRFMKEVERLVNLKKII
ncbi:fatty-acid amide hydrolase 1-like isoform X2 [Hypanus sabinus]|uniref:fatty-acid amide hydrolase 1-like isoform X2 n=1 Tax=Hypanus sabinus TaxID=79690 RepID=UPI0028C38840|nr:fatty-acid amide hydrolase 1-like isoform X2 [Hypanus sabinus]